MGASRVRAKLANQQLSSSSSSVVPVGPKERVVNGDGSGTMLRSVQTGACDHFPERDGVDRERWRGVIVCIRIKSPSWGHSLCLIASLFHFLHMHQRNLSF